MKTYKVQVGSVGTDRSGRSHGEYQDVEFKAEKLGETSYLTGSDDTRGVEETLYRTEDGRLILYEYYWSRWQGESSTRRLFEVSEDELAPNGQYWRLGKEAGFGRPLTLDEALEERE